MLMEFQCFRNVKREKASINFIFRSVTKDVHLTRKCSFFSSLGVKRTNVSSRSYSTLFDSAYYPIIMYYSFVCMYGCMYNNSCIRSSSSCVFVFLCVYLYTYNIFIYMYIQNQHMCINAEGGFLRTPVRNGFLVVAAVTVDCNYQLQLLTTISKRN